MARRSRAAQGVSPSSSWLTSKPCVCQKDTRVLAKGIQRRAKHSPRPSISLWTKIQGGKWLLWLGWYLSSKLRKRGRTELPAERGVRSLSCHSAVPTRGRCLWRSPFLPSPLLLFFPPVPGVDALLARSGVCGVGMVGEEWSPQLRAEGKLREVNM